MGSDGHMADNKGVISHPASMVMSELVTNGSIELSATALEKIPEAAALLPFGTSVYVPSPSNKSITSNLKLVAALHEAGVEAVPHIAARKVPSREALTDYLATVVKEYGVHRVLVIGGDISEPVGPYHNSISVLRDGVLAETGINEIGVAGYPEGHPRIPPQVLSDDLDEKLHLADQLGLGIEIITQFSFAPSRILEYCAALSHRAPSIPVYVGMPGPAAIPDLLRYARYCGVSSSVRALSDMGLKAVKRASHPDADEQLRALAQYCSARESSNVIGVHIFSFGGFERSALWMRNYCRQSA